MLWNLFANLTSHFPVRQFFWDKFIDIKGSMFFIFREKAKFSRWIIVWTMKDIFWSSTWWIFSFACVKPFCEGERPLVWQPNISSNHSHLLGLHLCVCVCCCCGCVLLDAHWSLTCISLIWEQVQNTHSRLSISLNQGSNFTITV